MKIPLEFIERLLHGRPVVWPETPEELESLCVFIGHQGIGPLFYQQFHGSAQWKNWPLFVREVLEEDFHKAATSHLLLQKELANVLDHLVRGNISPFLMKGMPLSFLIYPASNLRPFTDIDLLIEKKDIQNVKETMVSLGYEIPNAVSGNFVSHEFVCEKTDVYGVHHAYDFHWKISNPLIFSEILSYQEIQKAALPVPALGRSARTLSLEHALFLACVHRVAHHANEDRLIWLYDIHLLATRMAGNEIRDFLGLARQKRMVGVCQDGFFNAKRWFGTTLSNDSWHEFFIDHTKAESSSIYLKPGNMRRRNILSNWRELPSLQVKFKWLAEYAFPNPEYMFKKYSMYSYFLLPFFYVHRGCLGFYKLLSDVSRKNSYI